jgi:SAM-dependent methyltransferase
MISDKLKKIYTDIHNTTPFGKRGKIPDYLKQFIKEKKPGSILDFGCGKGRLMDTIKGSYPAIEVYGYDPANPKYDIDLENTKVDMVISSDVLEHIEPEFIIQTLSDLRNKSKYYFHLIACSPAKLILPDGRNAHLIVEDNNWWRQKFLHLGYSISDEKFLEFEKIPKGWKKTMLIKKYFVMGETNGIAETGDEVYL